MARFKISVDSTAYLTREESINNGVQVIPMSFTIKDNCYQEYFLNENNDQMKLIETEIVYCKTSRPSYTAYQSAFSRLINEGSEVLHLSISSRLSGAYNNALLVASSLTEDKIKIFDTLSAFGGEKILIDEAVRYCNNDATIEDTIEHLTKLRDRIKIVFTVDDIDALRRGGRIGTIKQSINNVLNIRPILIVKDGAIESIDTANGQYSIIRKMVKLIPSDTKKIIIIYVNEDTPSVNILISEIEKLNLPVEIIKQRSGPVIAIHLGKNAFGYALYN